MPAGLLELRLKNNTEARQTVAPALAQFAAAHRLAPNILNALDLALEEHLANLCKYAYQDNAEHTILVRLSVNPPWVEALIEDDGVAFDPRSYPPVDTSVPLEQRPVGGLGIHLIRNSVDELHYRREGEKNIVVFKKRIGSNAP